MLTGCNFPVVIGVISNHGACVSRSLRITERTGTRLTGLGRRNRTLIITTGGRRKHVLGRTVRRHSGVVRRTHGGTRTTTRGRLSRIGGRVRVRGRRTVHSVHHRMTLLSMSVTRGIVHGGLGRSDRRVTVVSQVLSRILSDGGWIGRCKCEGYFGTLYRDAS